MKNIKSIENTITFEIEGTEANERHLELHVLQKQLALFGKLLDSSVKDSDCQGVMFRVVGISHSSPVTLQCQSVDKAGQPVGAPIHSIKHALNAVREPMEENPSDLLIDIRELAKPDTNISSRKITIKGGQDDNAQIYKLDDKFWERLPRPENREYVEISTIDGDLEEINAHKTPHTFKIYNAGAHRKTIICEFPPELLDEARAALKNGVFVSGDFHYNVGDLYPYKIKVDKIEKLPPADNLPSLKDLKGIAPGLTGGKDPVQFVRDSRRKWDE